MSSSGLPKLWTKPTKIGHIFRKQSTLKIKVFKKISFIKFDVPVKYSSQKFFLERFDQFRHWKMTLKLRILRSLTMLFIILVGLTMSLFSDEMLISHRCIRGLMPNLIKKSWTVPNVHLIQIACTALRRYYVHT